MTHDFKQKLEYSLGERKNFDIDLLKKCFAKCISIQKTDIEADKNGIDYIATLTNGATINIDAKTREKGASKFWKYDEPELALEVWSIEPSNTYPGKIGWTLDNSTLVDYILYTFDKSDSDKFFLLPFQILRTVFYNKGKEWTTKYGTKKQTNSNWTSKAIFVPASVILAEINKQMAGIAYC